MIKLGFDVAAAIMLSCVVALIVWIWLRERDRAGVEDDAAGNIRQCPYCSRMCVNDRDQKVMLCPVCKSYFEEEVL
jgi:hypothetical protein